MKVIRHQHVGGQDPREPLDAGAEQLEEKLTILIIEKNVLAGIAATGDVMQRSGIFETKLPLT
jgi:hypothetical protein